jgi:putative addiction module component (TIGR02574 family)
MATVEQVWLEASKLSVEERLRLADDLYESVPGDELYEDPAFLAEMKRRVAEIEAGDVSGSSPEEVVARVKAALAGEANHRKTAR